MDAATSQNKEPILLVDHNPNNRALAIGLLNKLGFTAEVATNGQEALRLIAIQKFPLILMDVYLPGMDGLETTREIRQPHSSDSPALQHAANTPIIALTAQTLPGDRERFLSAGLNDHLPKPLTLESLQSTLNKWLPSGLAQPHHHPGQTDARKKTPISIWDPQVLCRELGEDEDFIRQIVAASRQEISHKMSAMVEAIDRDDRETVRSVAHSIKGMAATLYAYQLRDIADALEKVAVNPTESPQLHSWKKYLQENVEQLFEAFTDSHWDSPLED